MENASKSHGKYGHCDPLTTILGELGGGGWTVDTEQRCSANTARVPCGVRKGRLVTEAEGVNVPEITDNQAL